MELKYDDLTKKIDYLSEKMFNCSKIGDEDTCGEIMTKRNKLIEQRLVLMQQIKMKTCKEKQKQ